MARSYARRTRFGIALLPMVRPGFVRSRSVITCTSRWRAPGHIERFLSASCSAWNPLFHCLWSIPSETNVAGRFARDQDTAPIRSTGFQFLSEAYHITQPEFAGRYTVPCLWDRVTKRLVSNNFADITIDFETQFGEYHAPNAPDLYPMHLRAKIDAINAVIYEDVNDGVYKAGFATTQAAYEVAITALFARLDWLEERLSAQRFLVGDQMSEADIRLFPTLVHFDAVYYGHFKCNLRRLVDYPNLWGYARDIYQHPGVADTINSDHIKRHYYMTHDQLNPTRIVPLGPLVDWTAPHTRNRLR